MTLVGWTAEADDSGRKNEMGRIRDTDSHMISQNSTGHILGECKFNWGKVKLLIHCYLNILSSHFHKKTLSSRALKVG